MNLPASRTIHGLIAVLIGVILTWLGIAVPEEDIGETVTLVLMVIGGIAQVYGIIRSWAARYERGDVTLTGKKTALTKVEVIPVTPHREEPLT